MRVEYADYGLGSTYNLVITAKEFLKAEDSDEEMGFLTVLSLAMLVMVISGQVFMMMITKL